MKHILLLLLSFFAPVVWGQQVEQFKLWPDKPEAGEAEIFVYHPAKNGKLAPAVLICPGGGYRGLAINHEGHDMAKWYASNGFVAVVLKYRMPEGVHTIPLSDAEKAMSVIRGNATKWNLDAFTFDLHHNEDMVKGNVMTEYEEKFSSMGNPICKMVISR